MSEQEPQPEPQSNSFFLYSPQGRTPEELEADLEMFSDPAQHAQDDPAVRAAISEIRMLLDPETAMPPAEEVSGKTPEETPEETEQADTQSRQRTLSRMRQQYEARRDRTRAS